MCAAALLAPANPNRSAPRALINLSVFVSILSPPKIAALTLVTHYPPPPYVAADWLPPGLPI
ncbi:hypothetical protein LCGC14_2945570, partial [marine sediment metagenome]